MVTWHKVVAHGERALNHLVIPCDRFNELPKGSDRHEQFAFWTDHTKTEDKNDKHVAFMTDSKASAFLVQKPL